LIELVESLFRTTTRAQEVSQKRSACGGGGFHNDEIRLRKDITRRLARRILAPSKSARLFDLNLVDWKRREHMLRRILLASVVAVCLGLTCRAVSAQQVVHALTGTVSAIDPSAKTITVFLDGGSEDVFNDRTNLKAPLSVDKRLIADATAVDAFKKKGAYVIVFYFGGRDSRTAVALRSLGAGPFTAAEGTVEKFESHDHSITIADKTGTLETFKISADTVAEGDAGAVGGFKFQAQKGEHVRVVGSSENGSPIALYVSEM
jgi:hypothetical protein